MCLCRAGLVRPDLAINFTKYLENEEEYVPWFSAEKVFSAFDSVLSTTAIYGRFRVSIKILYNTPADFYHKHFKDI